MTDLQKIHNGCAVCHAQFGSLKAFDKHQDVDYARSPAVMCRTPEGLGLVQDGHGSGLRPSGWLTTALRRAAPDGPQRRPQCRECRTGELRASTCSGHELCALKRYHRDQWRNRAQIDARNDARRARRQAGG